MIPMVHQYQHRDPQLILWVDILLLAVQNQQHTDTKLVLWVDILLLVVQIQQHTDTQLVLCMDILLLVVQNQQHTLSPKKNKNCPVLSNVLQKPTGKLLNKLFFV